VALLCSGPRADDLHVYINILLGRFRYSLVLMVSMFFVYILDFSGISVDLDHAPIYVLRKSELVILV
jgi:hypothetical protein